MMHQLNFIKTKYVFTLLLHNILDVFIAKLCIVVDIIGPQSLNEKIGYHVELNKVHIQKYHGLVCRKGEELCDARIERGSRATALAWHPTRSTIACGWESGHATIHDVLPTPAVVSAVQLPSRHCNVVAIIVAAVWTSDGSRLLTGNAVTLHDPCDICLLRNDAKVDTRGSVLSTLGKGFPMTSS